jgi:pimeloyl-ACP methyl ester carboxylesterase
MDWFSDGLCVISGRRSTTSPRSSSTRFSSQAHPQTKKTAERSRPSCVGSGGRSIFLGPIFLEVFEWIFRENRIAAGRFRALGRLVDLRELRCPLFLLAGDRDSIATAGQVLATATFTGTGTRDVETAIAPCGHLALFMGQETLKVEFLP